MAIESRSHKARLVFDELGGFDQFGPDILHSAEGPKHMCCKLIAAHLIQEAGRDVAIEADTPGGEIDVLDLGESERGAVAIELETSCSPQRKREKLEQYQTDLIQEVITLPIADAPDDIGELREWLRERIPAV